MKKIGLMLLAILTLVSVAAFGYEKAGPLGSVSAIGIATYAVSWLANGYMEQGRLFVAIGALRPLRKGESNLGGIISLTIYVENQFTPGANWPVRGKGKVAGPIPLIASETGAVFTFKPGTLKGSFTQTGDYANETFKHFLEGITNGFTQEQLDTLDDLYNQNCIAIAEYPNGDNVVYGSTRAWLHSIVSGETGAAPEDANGKFSTIKFESILGCDFPPRKLASTLTIAKATVPAYPTPANGVTP